MTAITLAVAGHAYNRPRMYLLEAKMPSRSVAPIGVVLTLAIAAGAYGAVHSLKSDTPTRVDHQPPTCSAAKPASLAGAAPKVRTNITQITPVTSLMAENWQNTILVRKPATAAGEAAYDMRVFLAPVGVTAQDLAGKNSKIQELTVLNAEQPTEAVVKSFALTKPTDWYQLRLDTLRLTDHRLTVWPVERALLVFACDASNGVAAVGQTPVLVSGWATSMALAVGLGALIYLAAATATYGFRRKLSSQKTVQPPLRWRPVARYSFWRCLDPVVITADIFDHGSLSKLQVLVFTLLIVVFLAAIALCTGMLQDISPTIALLLGLPALGAIGSQVASVTRDRLGIDNWSWLVTRGVLPLNDGGADKPRWRDLFVSGDEVDMYKLQAAAFSVVVIYAMLRTGASHLGQFAVPESIITVLGLSQVVLVGGRFAKATSIGDLDGLITELRTREDQLRAAIATGADLDDEGRPLGAAVTVPAPYADLKAAQAAGLVKAVGRYRDAAAQVEIVLEALTHRDVQAGGLRNPDINGSAGAASPLQERNPAQPAQTA